MDTVDLYYIHRWDCDTPIEMRLRTLDDAVCRNQVRYVDASSMWARQFAEALHTSDLQNLGRFQTIQNHYNLVYYEDEFKMLPTDRARGRQRLPVESTRRWLSRAAPRERRPGDQPLSRGTGPEGRHDFPDQTIVASTQGLG